VYLRHGDTLHSPPAGNTQYLWDPTAGLQPYSSPSRRTQVGYPPCCRPRSPNAPGSPLTTFPHVPLRLSHPVNSVDFRQVERKGGNKPLDPYKNGCAPFSFTQILYRACSARIGSAVMCNRNLPVFVSLPRQVPRLRRASRLTLVARLAMERRT